jgi:hypothetical protein
MLAFEDLDQHDLLVVGSGGDADDVLIEISTTVI